MQNISLRSLGTLRKQKSAFSPSYIFAFLASFFSFVAYLVGFILVGNVFTKALRILRLDERKGRWVVKQDFHGNFWVNVTWFFAFSPVSLTELH